MPEFSAVHDDKGGQFPRKVVQVKVAQHRVVRFVGSEVYCSLVGRTTKVVWREKPFFEGLAGGRGGVDEGQ